MTDFSNNPVLQIWESMLLQGVPPTHIVKIANAHREGLRTLIPSPEVERMDKDIQAFIAELEIGGEDKAQP